MYASVDALMYTNYYMQRPTQALLNAQWHCLHNIILSDKIAPDESLI